MLKEIIEKVFGKKGPKIKGPYALVSWKEEAEKFCVGRDEMKEILVIENGVIKRIYPFIQDYLKWLEDELGIPVIDETKGQTIPKTCVEKGGYEIRLGEFY